ARRLPVRDASVDQALSVWVLHVVGDAAGVLREVGRVLRPGGRYAVMPGGGQSPDDEIGRRTQAIERALDPERRRDDSAERVAELAPEAGFRVHAMDEHAWEFERSPMDVADALESRSQSYLWDVDDARWNEHVVPVIEWLRSLPDPERPIVRRARDTLIVLERE
ncbi:MAG TPA: methyltransferase domain-containing protein, partial [Actinomycetota bacterium]|nr:methyltransferase domain-containing protein [Actinomycetota bacterium]